MIENVILLVWLSCNSAMQRQLLLFLLGLFSLVAEDCGCWYRQEWLTGREIRSFRGLSRIKDGQMPNASVLYTQIVAGLLYEQDRPGVTTKSSMYRQCEVLWGEVQAVPHPMRLARDHGQNVEISCARFSFVLRRLNASARSSWLITSTSPGPGWQHYQRSRCTAFIPVRKPQLK